MTSSRPTHLLSSYYAPRGAHRMYALGQQIAQLYLSPNDKLIGVIGEAGSGKSALIRGMFPGLELTNDDHGVYVRPLPILEQDRGFAFFSPHTYHLDIRFENGFTQMSELADAISEALNKGRRVVVEHFDLVYPLLGANANLLLGVGEQVLVARPNVFGPEPDEIKEEVYNSLHYRLMAHTAEDIIGMYLSDADNERCGHADLRHGFAITFPDFAPDIDLEELEKHCVLAGEVKLPSVYGSTPFPHTGPEPSCSPRISDANGSPITTSRIECSFFVDLRTLRPPTVTSPRSTFTTA